MDEKKILILSDSKITALGLEKTLEDIGTVVTAHGSSPTEAIETYKPHLAVLAYRETPEGPLREVTNNGTVRAIIFDEFSRGDAALNALQLGATAYTSNSPDLRQAIKEIHNGKIYLSMDLITQTVKSWRQLQANETLTAAEAKAQEKKLSSRQKEIVYALSAGVKRANIGSVFFIADETAKNHLYNAFKALKVKDGTALVRQFQEQYSTFRPAIDIEERIQKALYNQKAGSR